MLHIINNKQYSHLLSTICTRRANENRTPKRTYTFRFTCRSTLSGLLHVEKAVNSEWMVDTLNNCFECGICLTFCYTLLCIVQQLFWMRYLLNFLLHSVVYRTFMRSKNVRAFRHCVSTVTVVLWQKVNLTNNHVIFRNEIGYISVS